MYGLQIDDNSSLSLTISSGFKAYSLIYKGLGYDNTIYIPLFPLFWHTVFVTSVTVQAQSTPLFFALSYSNGNSTYITPIQYTVSGNSYTAHFLRNPGMEFYVFTKEIKPINSDYGIQVYGENGGIVFNSDIKPLKVLHAGNASINRPITNLPLIPQSSSFMSANLVSGRKIALNTNASSIETIIGDHPEREGNYMRALSIRLTPSGNIEYIFPPILTFYNKDNIDIRMIHSYYAQNWGKPIYALAIDVTNL